MGRKSKVQLAEEKAFVDILGTIINKVNSFLGAYGEIKDIAHVVMELAKNEEIMSLIKKITKGDRPPQMFILLAAAILAALKKEMEDNDGMFDYTPSTAIAGTESIAKPDAQA